LPMPQEGFRIPCRAGAAPCVGCSSAACISSEAMVDGTPWRHPSKLFALALACVSASVVVVLQSVSWHSGSMPAAVSANLGKQPVVGLRRLRAWQSTSQDALADFKDVPTTGQRQLSMRPSTYQAVYITWARDRSKCLYVPGRPANGTEVEVWECPVDQSLITKFLMPVGTVGPVRLLAHPNYCLEAPGGGSLQISACGPRDSNRHLDSKMRFLVRPEALYWVRYPSMDLPNERDAEQMPADDLSVVQRRAEERGYGGFSVYQGVAWLKEGRGISRGDLHWMGQGDPCVFYVRREHDVTISPELSPNTCLDVTVPISGDVDVGNGQAVVISKCRKVESENNVAAMRFVPQVVQLDDEQWRRLRPVLELPGSAPPTNLKVVMMVSNVDHALLKEENDVFDAFARIIKETLAASAGIGPDSVTSMFSAGSVRVDCELLMPPGSSADAERAELQEDFTMTARLSSELQAIPGIDRFTTGKIGIHMVQQDGEKKDGERPTNKSPPAQMLNALIIAAMCLPPILVACLASWCCCRSMPKPGSGFAEMTADNELTESNDTLNMPIETSSERNSDEDSNDALDMSGQHDVWRMGRILRYSKLDEQPSAYDVLLDGRGSPAQCLQDRFVSGRTLHALDAPSLARTW